MLRCATIFCDGLGEESKWCSVIESQWKGPQKEWERQLKCMLVLSHLGGWLDWVWPLFSSGHQTGCVDGTRGPTLAWSPTPCMYPGHSNSAKDLRHLYTECGLGQQQRSLET